MVIGACVLGSTRADVGAILVVLGAVAAWVTYRADPLQERGIRPSTVIAIAVLVVGVIAWLPVCIEGLTAT